MSEQSEAKRDGAKLQKNSGRGQIQKGDAKWRGFLVDYKESEKSFSLSEKTWAKVCTDAFRAGGAPLLKIIIGTGRKVRLALIEFAVLEDLLEQNETLREELALLREEAEELREDAWKYKELCK